MSIVTETAIAVVLLSGFGLAILSDELETRRISAIDECLSRFFTDKGEREKKEAMTRLDSCKAQHGLDQRFRWDNPVLHLLAFPACKYRNGWDGNCPLLNLVP